MSEGYSSPRQARGPNPTQTPPPPFDPKQSPQGDPGTPADPTQAPRRSRPLPAGYTQGVTKADPGEPEPGEEPKQEPEWPECPKEDCPDPLPPESWIPKPDPWTEDVPPEEGPEQQVPGTAPAGDSCKGPEAGSTAEQLTALQSRLNEEQQQAEQLERVKTSITDLTQRIQALQKAVDGQGALTSGYREFYRTTQVLRSEIDCFIPTVRCQLTLNEADRACIRKVVDQVETKVRKARKDYEDQRKRVSRYDRQYQRAAWELANAKALFEFFKSGLTDQVKKKRDDMSKLKQLADPAKNNCEVEFYLREMESLLPPMYPPDSAACYPPNDLNLGTYLNCWAPECYQVAYDRALVDFNNAEYAEKCRKSLLDAANKRLGDLEKAAKEAVDKRREWILAGLKAEQCCAGGKAS